MPTKLICSVTFCFGLMALTSLKASDLPPAKSVNFLPLTISIACDANTNSQYQVQYMRAPGARQEVRTQECADQRRTIDDVIPHTADVEYSDSFHIWLVGITLNGHDALAVRKMVADNVGKLMLIGVGHKILSISQIGGPLHDNKIYINADSQHDAHNVMMLLTGA